MVRPYKLPELFGTPDWDKCLVDMDKIKPSGIYIPEDLDLSDVPDINSAEWDHMYDDLPEEDEPEKQRETRTAGISCPPLPSKVLNNGI